ncbi:hypothetical protein FDY93_04895 [Microbulbifer harenosus]|uniref:Uncharacterized protein n=1 Tax=Microbulbifer harenosus TaxID=2576840 RepID=A0ABY2UK33_9GAMM|nr:hypothetical protein FDY93_04895 [Microbulbifer harenosus]
MPDLIRHPVQRLRSTSVLDPGMRRDDEVGRCGFVGACLQANGCGVQTGSPASRLLQGGVVM